MRNLKETQSGARGRAELFNQRLFQLVSLEEVNAKERSNPLNWKREKGDKVGHSNMLQQSQSFPIEGWEVRCEVSQRDGHDGHWTYICMFSQSKYHSNCAFFFYYINVKTF